MPLGEPESELSRCGLLPLVESFRTPGAAAFFAKTSLQKEQLFDRQEVTISYRAMTELRNVLVLGRLVQHLRRLAAESLASEPAELEKRLGTRMAERPDLFPEGSGVRVLPPDGERALQLELVVVPETDGRGPAPTLRLRAWLE